MHKLVPISKIVSNPFRNMDRYPIDESKIESLMASMNRTGFWDNLVGRQKNGSVELGYGHHRWIAFERKFGKNSKMYIAIRDISNDDMMRMMADENANDYGGSAEIEIETIRALVEAYARGDIKGMPRVGKKVPKNTIRYAPSFLVGNNVAVADRNMQTPYTAMTVASFFGWTTTRRKGKSFEPRHAVNVAIRALEAAEKGIIAEEDTKGLSREQAAVVASGATTIDNTYEQAAKASCSSTKRKAIREKGKKVAKATAKKTAKKIREKGIGTREAKKEMQKAKAEQPKNKQLPTVERFVGTLTKDLHKILGPKDNRCDRLNKIVDYRDGIDTKVKKGLVNALGLVMKRCGVMIEAIEGTSKKLLAK